MSLLQRLGLVRTRPVEPPPPAPPPQVPDLVIRPLRHDDLPALEWGGELIHFRRMYAQTWEAMRRGDRLMLTAEVDGEHIGQVFMQFRSTQRHLADGHRRGYIYAFRVKPHWRNKGVGTALLIHAEYILRRRGYTVGVIAVGKDNPRAHALYARHGYRIIGENEGRWHYVDHEGSTQEVHEPCYILEKRLA